MNFKASRKGQVYGALMGVVPAVLVLVVIGIVLSMGALTQAKVGSQMTSDSLEYNATTKSKEGIKVLSDFQPTWGTIVAIGVVITILLAAFAGILYFRS